MCRTPRAACRAPSHPGALPSPDLAQGAPGTAASRPSLLPHHDRDRRRKKEEFSWTRPCPGWTSSLGWRRGC
ncbi:hypothetical protein DVA86_33350 [Streptomyces armeniacus]|uniref:Uncharacterized protein n=1 Tax=Streptomyces armeniacus TaxID=83291 RepID=A0A345XYK4_9ACTN|nr:hypothetical protein DVA86_33350 [Streptomyces armeniacus]